VSVVLTLLGALLVAVALRDVFNTLFHPHARGVVGETLMRTIWRGARAVARGNHHVLSVAGPIAFLAVIAAWGTLVVIGFALVIWAHLPEGYTYAAPLDPAQHDSFWDALYLSMVNVTSLGYGDIAPTSTGLRLLGPLETVIGLGLLTASISWILFVYQVLAHYRALSHEISLLADAERSSGTHLAELEPAVASEVLGDLTSRMLAMRDDFLHAPIAYYFHPRDARHALPVLLPGLLDVVERCSASECAAALRFEAEMLRSAIDDLLSVIAEDFVRSPAPDAHEALDAYRRDHLWA
jgi:hypothetical protein